MNDFLRSEVMARMSSPRELARITEDPETWATYRARCETCAHEDTSTSLSLVAKDAEWHAVTTGHAVRVEAL